MNTPSKSASNLPNLRFTADDHGLLLFVPRPQPRQHGPETLGHPSTAQRIRHGLSRVVDRLFELAS
jgi:hypothetical protein